MKRQIIRNLFLFLVSVIGIREESFASELRDMVEVKSVITPNEIFFGNASVVVETTQPWALDLGNGFTIEVIPWESKYAGDYWDSFIQYKLYDCRKDPFLVSETRVKTTNQPSGVRVSQIDGKMLITGTTGVTLFEDSPSQIPSLDVSASIRLLVSSKTKANILKFDSRFEPHAIPTRYNLEGFIEPDYTTQNADDHLGYWHYLDRKVASDGSVVVGGRYEIAIVPEETGNLDTLLIVYVNGATDSSDIWQPGDIKGRLTSTTFPNHYNLEWYDSQHRAVGFGESSATFEGVNLLRLDFPIFDSQIRFERTMPKAQ